MTHILFTGGGSAGHVTPNIALIKAAESLGWKVSYAGSLSGIEHQLIEPLHIPFYGIDSGKLARQLTLKNLLSPFRVLHGIWQSFFLCRKIKPNLVFSKGGFVSVPLVIGAWLNGIPVISHESDLTPGLANRISYPFSKRIALSFPQSEQYFRDKHKLIYTGTPVREAMLHANAESGKSFLNFGNDKPILLVYGGGLGSAKINETIRKTLPELLKSFNVVHCCGKGKTDPRFEGIPGYKPFDYLNEELPNVMAASDMVISRAGANSIYELLSLQKPHLLIPLSKQASRGDQIDNAKYFEKLGLSRVLLEENLSEKTLLAEVARLEKDKEALKSALEKHTLPNAQKTLLELMQAYLP